MIAEITKYSCVLLLSVFMSACAQVLLKKSALKTYATKIKEYLNPYVITGYGIFFLATFFSVVAYKKVPLSYGGILESTSLLYATFFGKVFFHEKINVRKIIAMLVIILGIIIFSIK